MYNFDISDKILSLSDEAERDLAEVFARFDSIALENTGKVLAAFRKNRVSPAMFAQTTGYGYDDIGRDTLEKLYADIFSAKSALVRTGFVNGTHAIASSLFAALKPGDVLLSATGLPYDTLQAVIGITGNYHGSLRFYGIEYRQVDLQSNGAPDFERIKDAASDKRVKAVSVQRSGGYGSRPALPPEIIGDICSAVHSVNPDSAVIVDNCYGEFTKTVEPLEYGADLIAGSLIKNPGGGLASTGGYIAGNEELVENAAMRLTVPGIGGECGCSLADNRILYQGLFMAPHTVANALKTAAFASGLLERMGFSVSPKSKEERSDIIQSINFASPALLNSFCQAIQSFSPVDSFAVPLASDMPGYEDKIIMAAGTFVQGASIELSCDAPMREPYTAYLQGALTYEAGKLGVMCAADSLLKDKTHKLNMKA